MAQLEEAGGAHSSAEEINKPKSQSSVRIGKKLVEESEQSDSGKQNPNEQGETEEGEENEEEYEIEQILDTKYGMFKKNEMAYLVKWKGYESEHNSWVTESDAGNAKELIDEFRRSQTNPKQPNRGPSARGRKPTSAKSAKIKEVGTPEDVSVSISKRVRGKTASSSDDEDEENMSRKSKKSRTNTNVNGSASAKRGTLASLNRTDDEDIAMVDATETVNEQRNWTTMKDLKMGKLKDWEDVVKTVTTVDCDKNGLMVYFETRDGKYVREPSSICRQKFPQKLIQFYESHLRWRAASDD